MKKAILIDIDDCILNTIKRKKAIFEFLLKKKVPVSEIIGKRTAEILSKYVSIEKVPEYRFKFWSIALCVDPIGEKFLYLDEPEPYARYILRKLSNKYEIFYITNRLVSMQKYTELTLKKFNFPKYWNIISADDYTFFKNENGRKTVIKKLPAEYEYTSVVDDLPENYIYYKQINIKKIIGYMKYIVLDEKSFYDHGASLVIKSWKEFPLKQFL